MVNAIVRVTSSGTDFNAGNYNLTIQVDATDGSADQTGSTLVQVALGTSAKGVDAALRAAAAAYILAQWSWTIDPNDIYVPFS